MAIQIRRGLDSAWESNNSNIVSGEPAITTDTGRFFVGVDDGEFVEFASKSYVDSKDSLTDSVKQALLQIASKVAYIDANGQDYYDALESALYAGATLVSISAVYTQSNTVFPTDSLDSLKTDLVVTATYSDTSTATIPSGSYTLSGTLTAGTSAITVTYQGKTTTFNVTVTAYTWLYRADSNELLSAQNYVTTATGGGGGTEALSSGQLVLTTMPSGSSSYLRFNLTDTTTINARLSARIKFNRISHTSTSNAGAEGFRMQLSNGTTGAQAFFVNQPLDNTNLGCSYFEGSTRKYVDLSAYDIDKYHIIELELANGTQTLTIDGTEIFSTSTLSSNYCTSNSILNQCGASSATPDGVQTTIDWLGYYEVA